MSAVPRNPFIVSGRILPEYFCDRRNEAARLMKEVTNGNNVVLVSPRRMGKTGLIHFCFDRQEITEKYNVFFIDILQTSSLREFTFLLGREIFRRLAPGGMRKLKTFLSVMRSLSGKFGFDALSGTPTFSVQMGDIVDPELTMEEIFSYLSSSELPCIVAIDEFQQIASYKEKNVEALLRGHIQRIPDTTFVFAGSERHILQQMFASSARPFYNSASMMELGAIPLEEYREFACRLFRERDRDLEDAVVDTAYRLVEGHTFYLQKIFNTAFADTPGGAVCGMELLDGAMRDMLEAYDTVYRENLSRLSESQKGLLVAVARAGKATSITSARFVRDNALVSASAVQSAVKRLLAAEVLCRVAGAYSIADPLLRLWILLTYTPATLRDIVSAPTLLP